MIDAGDLQVKVERRKGQYAVAPARDALCPLVTVVHRPSGLRARCSDSSSELMSLSRCIARIALVLEGRSAGWDLAAQLAHVELSESKRAVV